MNKQVIILALLLFHCACGCSNGRTGPEPADTAARDYQISENSDISDTDEGEEEMETDAVNRTLIAEAIHVEENDRSLRFILSSLRTIRAGKIQSAESVEIKGKKAIELVAEDGTNYRIYLSGSGGVEGVKNLDTNEWPMLLIR